MFTSLESGKDESELQSGGLSLKRNPLVVSIIDGCETLKALSVKNKITPELLTNAKGLILMRTDKVRPHGHPSSCQQHSDAVLLTSAVLLQIGFGISVTQGYGLVVTRQPGTQCGW
jgi:hypothetical protein